MIDQMLLEKSKLHPIGTDLKKIQNGELKIEFKIYHVALLDIVHSSGGVVDLTRRRV